MHRETLRPRNPIVNQFPAVVFHESNDEQVFQIGIVGATLAGSQTTKWDGAMCPQCAPYLPPVSRKARAAPRI